MAKRKLHYERPWMYPKQSQALFDCVDFQGNPARVSLIEASTKAGKSQSIQSLIQTPLGAKRMGAIQIGDEVFAGDGSVTHVTGLFPQGVLPLFRVEFEDGGSTLASADHLWTVQNADGLEAVVDTAYAMERGRDLLFPAFMGGFTRRLRRIAPAGMDQAQCISIAHPSRLYVTDDWIVTHNTSGCIAWLFEQAILGKRNQNFWWVAPVYTQAKIAFRRMKEGLPKHLFKANESELTITLVNGAVIWFRSAEKPDNLYGDDVHAAVLDEASRMREESWHAIRSTLTATNGPLRIIGNVKGRKNFFFRMARMAEAGSAGMAYTKINAYDAVAGGILKAEEIEDAKRLLPENVFRELYLAEPSADEGNPFGYQHIQACIGELSDQKPVAIGIDLAKSEDWTVVIALDKAGRVCGFERWQGVPWNETIRRIVDLVRHVPTLVDATGVGDPIVEALQRKCHAVEGFVFSASSKQRLMEGLAMAIQSHHVAFPPGPIVQEAELFEYVFSRTGVKYSAPEGYHDDCVMALGLAVAKWREINPLGSGVEPHQIPRISPWLDAEPAEGDFL